MSLRVSSSIVLLLLITFLSSSVHADSWALPVKKKYYSPDRKYCLEVIPKQLESQLSYFKGKAEGKTDAGAVKGLKDNRAKAIFYVNESIGYSKKHEFPLVNEVSPVNAVVSADGRYVVTFDNWHQVGYGDDVVVIYQSNGALVKKFGLADLFTESDIRSFIHTASSIWWGTGHYIDDKNEILHLKAGPEEAGREVTIEIASGRRLGPITNIFSQTKVVDATPGEFKPFDALGEHTVKIEPAEAPSTPSPGEPVCNPPEAKFDSSGAMQIPSEQLFSKAKSLARPPYPPIARAARVEGKVIVEVLVSKKSGEVICARTLSGHPLLVRAASSAAKYWRFEPLETSADASNIVSTVAVHFKLQ